MVKLLVMKLSYETHQPPDGEVLDCTYAAPIPRLPTNLFIVAVCLTKTLFPSFPFSCLCPVIKYWPMKSK